MNKKGKKIKTAICVFTAAVIAAAPFAYAYNVASNARISGFGKGVQIAAHESNYDAIIQEAEQTKKEYQQKAAETQQEINSLNAEYESISAYVKELDEKQSRLAEEITQIGQKMDALNEEKAETEAELEEAIRVRDEQYETMSARIKYVYENGETSYLDIVFDSKNITDILNRVEYVSEISKYDDALLTKYANSVRKVSEYNDTLTIQIETITQVQEAYDKYYELSKELIETKNKALEECAEKKGVALDVYQRYMNEIESQQMTIDEAIAAKAAEEEKAKRALEEAQRREAELKRQKEEAQRQQTAQQTGQTGQTTQTGQTGQTGLSNDSSLYSMIWPCPSSHRISSYFGYRVSPTAGASSYHRGLDIGAYYGSDIVAAAAGTVVEAGYNWSCGNYVIIDHGTFRTVYMHASRLNTTAGSYVQRGQTIAYVGSTGISTGPHLHFGVMINGEYVNPQLYVS